MCCMWVVVSVNKLLTSGSAGERGSGKHPASMTTKRPASTTAAECAISRLLGGGAVYYPLLCRGKGSSRSGSDNIGQPCTAAYMTYIFS